MAKKWHQVYMQRSCIVPLLFCIISTCTGNTNRTYDDLLEVSEDCSHYECVPNYSMLILMWLLGCQKQWYNTVKCIAAPTRPSVRGESKLWGSPLVFYWSKEWIPRIRNAGGKYVIKHAHQQKWPLENFMLPLTCIYKQEVSALIMLTELLKGLQHQFSVVSFGLGEHQVKAMQVEGKECTEQVQKLTIHLRAVKLRVMWWNEKASTRSRKRWTDLCR